MRVDEPAWTMSRDLFGTLPDRRPVERVTLRGRNGFEAAMIAQGAAVQALHVPDRDGRRTDIVLGHDRLEPYLQSRNFFGATVGRYANRIADGTFLLDGTRHALSVNDGRNTLHGGASGFDRSLWSVEAAEGGPEPFVTFGLVSSDGQDGFPGTLSARVTYQITGGQSLSISFEATTDRTTVVNLSHHGYFNLGGAAEAGDILDHELLLMADRYLPVDSGLIPRGSPEPVAGTPFDFRSPRPIGARIREAHQQLLTTRGYDHCFLLTGGRAPAPRLAARVVHPASGRVLEVLTDQPALQFYSGNFLDGTVTGKQARIHRQSDAFCLEPQLCPDAPNRPDFASARLEPGERYRHVSIYRFCTT